MNRLDQIKQAIRVDDEGGRCCPTVDDVLWLIEQLDNQRARDRMALAGFAMQAYLTNTDYSDESRVGIAVLAVGAADALLARLEVQP